MQLKHTGKTTILIVLGTVVLLLLAGVAGFFAKSYYDLRQNPGKISEEETQRLTTAVGKLYQLPNDETPIIGKVQDKEKLKEQPFFKNAENGDDLLMYQNAKIAIIYRAKDNKLINVGPIAINAAPEPGKAAASVKIFNATTKTGAAADALKKVGEIAGLSLSGQVNEAKQKQLSQTTVVALNAEKAELATQIAEKLGAKVGTLPEGETAPDVDIAVFVGAQ